MYNARDLITLRHLVKESRERDRMIAFEHPSYVQIIICLPISTPTGYFHAMICFLDMYEKYFDRTTDGRIKLCSRKHEE